jgi:hypothetical protein
MQVKYSSLSSAAARNIFLGAKFWIGVCFWHCWVWSQFVGGWVVSQGKLADMYTSMQASRWETVIAAAQVLVAISPRLTGGGDRKFTWCKIVGVFSFTGPLCIQLPVCVTLDILTERYYYYHNFLKF